MNTAGFLRTLIHTCTIQRRHKCQKLTFTAAIGTPVVGQTVTGSTSHKTAVITRVFTGYLVVKDLSGTFTTGEPLAIGTSWSATLGTQSNYANQQGSPEWYWSDDQTAVACLFYYGGKSGNVELAKTGDLVLKPLSVMLPSTATIADKDYRIASTETDYSGTFDVNVFPMGGKVANHHREAVLTKVPSP
jgi:hypothetical protein